MSYGTPTARPQLPARISRGIRPSWLSYARAAGPGQYAYPGPLPGGRRANLRAARERRGDVLRIAFVIGAPCGAPMA